MKADADLRPLVAVHALKPGPAEWLMLPRRRRFLELYAELRKEAKEPR